MNRAEVFQAFSNGKVIGLADSAEHIREDHGKKQNCGEKPRHKEGNEASHSVLDAEQSSARERELMRCQPIREIGENGIKSHTSQPRYVLANSFRPSMLQYRSHDALCATTDQAHLACPHIAALIAPK